jgi:hypothetical protein
VNTQSLRRTLAAVTTTATLSAALAAGVAAPASAAPPQDTGHATQSVTLPLTATAQTAQLGPWGTGYITFPSGVPVGGYASLTLGSDGTYQFSGHFHDSGAPSYNDHLVWAVRASDGTLFTFSHTGHMAGTFEPGSRNDDWNNTGHNPDIAAHWPALQAGWSWEWRANVNWDVAGDIDRIIKALEIAGKVVMAIIAVV